MLTPGSDSTLASKKAGLNVLKQFLLSTHDHKPDGSRGKEYETDPDILKPEVFLQNNSGRSLATTSRSFTVVGQRERQLTSPSLSPNICARPLM